MKNKSIVPSLFNRRSPGSGARPIRAGFILATLLVAGAALFGPGGVQRAAAQFPLNHLNTSTPADYQWDEPNIFSIGVFQIEVNPNFEFLLAPVLPNTIYYSGYSPGSGKLTSPVMYDPVTKVSTSQRVNFSAPGFPLLLGKTSAGGFGTAAYNPANKIFGLGDYWGIPFEFAFPPVFPATMVNPDEVFTEIVKFDLSCGTQQLDCGNNVQVPGPPPVNGITMVSAGPDSFPTAYNPGPNVVVTAQNLRSIGMVQQQFPGAGSVLPAQSFFNIFVGINLPEITGTFTTTAFASAPPFGGYGFRVAQLYNDYQNPLVIKNTNVTKLPPEVVYIHGLTPAVELKFRFANLPHWNQDDVFGHVRLAGHGVFTNCHPRPTGPEPTNCCQEAVAALALVNTVLGPPGQPTAGMPIPWPRSANTFPTPGTSYGSLVNRMVKAGATNDLDDTMSFQFGVSTSIRIRNLQLGLFSNSIAPPLPNATATFSQTNLPVSFELSVNQGAWGPATGTGVVTMTISNTAMASSTMYYPNPPPQTNYMLRMTGFTSRSVGSFGPFFLRQNPAGTNATLGQHTIRSVASGGYTVASYLDADLQGSTDNVNYFSGLNRMRLEPSRPPATPRRPVISISLSGSQVTLSWTGTNILQSTTSLAGTPNWTDMGGPGTGPVTLPVSGVARYFRLKK